jgi:archaellum biogenesis protein FlaJ (TadC family)
MSLVTDQRPIESGIVLTKEQQRRRRARSIAIALALVVFVVLIYAVTLVKGPAVMIRPL